MAANAKLFEQRLATVRFNDLHQVAPILLERAGDLPQRVNREHEVKEQYRKCAQEVGDFYTQRSLPGLPPELKRFRQIQRERAEASKLLDQPAKGTGVLLLLIHASGAESAHAFGGGGGSLKVASKDE